MRTPDQLQASRINGALSRGPITENGKQASARNAVKHGLTSKTTIVLQGESQEAFDKLKDGFLTTCQPANDIERSYVVEAVHATWRRERAECIEAALLDLSYDLTAEKVERYFENCDEATRLAIAYKDAIGTDKALANIQLQITRLSRDSKRALDAFYKQRDRRRAEEAEAEVEAKAAAPGSALEAPPKASPEAAADTQNPTIPAKNEIRKNEPSKPVVDRTEIQPRGENEAKGLPPCSGR